VLLNLPESPMADLTRCLYLFTIMGSYVILIQPVFGIVEQQEYSAMKRISIIFGLLLMSMLFPDLNFILSLTGSFTGTLISVVLPVIFYDRAYK
jgi:hypothetical protein